MCGTDPLLTFEMGFKIITQTDAKPKSTVIKELIRYHQKLKTALVNTVPSFLTNSGKQVFCESIIQRLINRIESRRDLKKFFNILDLVETHDAQYGTLSTDTIYGIAYHIFVYAEFALNVISVADMVSLYFIGGESLECLDTVLFRLMHKRCKPLFVGRDYDLLVYHCAYEIGHPSFEDIDDSQDLPDEFLDFTSVRLIQAGLAQFGSDPYDDIETL